MRKEPCRSRYCAKASPSPRSPSQLHSSLASPVLAFRKRKVPTFPPPTLLYGKSLFSRFGPPLQWSKHTAALSSERENANELHQFNFFCSCQKKGKTCKGKQTFTKKYASLPAVPQRSPS